MSVEAFRVIALIDKIFMDNSLSLKRTLAEMVAIRDHVQERVNSLDADLGNTEPS